MNEKSIYFKKEKNIIHTNRVIHIERVKGL